MFFVNCAVPENIHPPRDWIRVSWVVGGSVGPKYLKKCVRLDWNFQSGGVGGEVFVEVQNEKKHNLGRVQKTLIWIVRVTR